MQANQIDLALLPSNGLRIRPLLNKQIVMDAQDASWLVQSRNQPDCQNPGHDPR
jgi:hypothetical protein